MLNHLGQLLNHYWTGLILLPFVLVISAKILKNNRNWLILWSSFLMMQGCIWFLKFAVNTQRPIGDHALESPSFPSGVAADAAFFATYGSILFPKYWLLFHIAGIGVALLRLHVGAHFPIDVVCGYLIGIIIALLSYKIARLQKSSNRT